MTDAAAERAALAEQLDGWVDVAARNLAGGDDQDVVFAQLALGLCMAADEQLADLAATAILRLAVRLRPTEGPVAIGPPPVDAPSDPVRCWLCRGAGTQRVGDQYEYETFECGACLGTGLESGGEPQ